MHQNLANTHGDGLAGLDLEVAMELVRGLIILGNVSQLPATHCQILLQRNDRLTILQTAKHLAARAFSIRI